MSAGRRFSAAARAAAAAIVQAAALAAASCDGAGGAVPAGESPLPPRAGTTAPGDGPAAAPPPAPPLPTFTDVAAEAGAIVSNHTGKPAQKDWLVSAMGGGTIAFDYDSDGDMDLLVVDGTMVTEAGELEFHDDWRTRLLRNDGGMRFTEVTKEAGIDVKAFGFGGAACDYDADGHPDVYVCCWGTNFLLRNRGDGTFEDVAARAGVAGSPRDMSTACAWGDVDGDGRMDLYVSNYADQRAMIEEFREKGMPGRSTRWREIPVYVGPRPLVPQADRLYLQQADGTFLDATETHLTAQRPFYGFQAVMTDVDNDGDLDVFVANDMDENHLWVNDGRGVFRDLAERCGVATTKDDAKQACMGADAGDIDRDGWLDLTVTNFSHDYNTIYGNKTRGREELAFADVSHNHGVVTPSYMRLAWGVKFLDYDNDGWLDHFTTCGHVYGEIDRFEERTGTTYRQRCQLLRNGGPTAYRLTDVTDQSGPAFQIRRVWRGAAFADLDDDGDTDVFAVGLNDISALFRNDGGNANAFVRFRLEGKGTRRDPCGARVLLHVPDARNPQVVRIHLEELHHGASFCSDNDPRLLFGCGSLTTIPRVDVQWPGGARQTFRDVPTRRAYRVVEGDDRLHDDRLVVR